MERGGGTKRGRRDRGKKGSREREEDGMNMNEGW